jgi:putative FmdB family regulatory protein
LGGYVPTYQYACTECGERLEVVQRFSDDPLTVCSACGGKLRKVFSPVGIVFKGSGFYRTDSRSGPVGAGASNGSGNGKESSGDGSTSAASSSDGAAAKSDGGGSSGSGSSGKESSGGGKTAAKSGASESSGSGGSSGSSSKVA